MRLLDDPRSEICVLGWVKPEHGPVGQRVILPIAEMPWRERCALLPLIFRALLGRFNAVSAVPRPGAFNLATADDEPSADFVERVAKAVKAAQRTGLL